MAWSEAARRASALVRQRMAEAKGRFHEYGTPKFDPYYTQRSTRTKVARELRAVRQKARSGVGPTYVGDIDVINRAAYTSSMARHWAAPKRVRVRSGRAFKSKKPKFMRSVRDY